MSEKFFTSEQIFDLLDVAELVRERSWKFGVIQTWIFPFENKYYQVEIEKHFSDGMQIKAGISGIAVVPQEKIITVWVPES